MSIPPIPWREALVILLLLLLNSGMSFVSLRPKYVDIVSRYRWVRFIIIFVVSYLYFSSQVKDGNYSLEVKIFSAIIVAFIFDIFLSADAVTLEEDSNGYLSRKISK